MNQISFEIENKIIGTNHPVYFIADIAANHDGDLEKAKELIYLAAEAGADAAKFQHFQANTIVSDLGFQNLSSISTHQSSWKKSVFDVYEDASVDLEWTNVLKETCKDANITFFTTPYSLSLVDFIDDYVSAYKVGSGDITWIEIINHVASKGKPYFIATGASSMLDVERAVNSAVNINPNLCLMQCNTNYTADLNNFKHINLNVLKLFRRHFPELLLGLSDHTPGHSTVLGAVALGAKVIEKHFTNDISQDGPDHKFAMDPSTWSDMVERTNELTLALGNGEKKVEDNEMDTAIVQRRSIFLRNDLKAGDIISKSNLQVLRPSPKNTIQPYDINKIIGMKVLSDKKAGESLKWTDIVQ
jgi:sialic acid synthase SpsE